MTGRPVLHDVVDRAARDMARRDPRPFLSSRVQAAIDAEPARSARRPAGWALAVCGAGVTAALWIVASAGSPVLPAVPAVAFVLASAPVPVPADAGALRLRVDPRAVRAARPATTETPVITDAERAWQAGAVPALAPFAPIDVQVTQPDEVAIPLLSVPALTVSPVVVPPIDVARWSRER